ncbi:MAG TPA: bifunctional metallophosphatase/5'-nucleotidase, partial [Pseudomonadota bacterium]|nr:bifunctional metallophosphatase/5'-nucleotidase [Pseudomonadota bacterium]
MSLFLGCSGPQTQVDGHTNPASPPDEVTVALVGTSDLHGYVEPRSQQIKDRDGTSRNIDKGGLTLLGGYLANLRKRYPVLLLDGGDLFQGTLVSNLGEGKAVIDGYNALGYSASALGNHEFDYGPDGPKSVPATPEDDPTGALKARIASAHFPFLSANVIDKKTGLPVSWPNIYPSRIVHIAGIPIGLVGAVTEDTPRTTNILNLRDVQIASIIPAV